MNTPICDFVNNYIKSNSIRLHMPGHKGNAHLGMEMLDITEINGADSLYEADGIINESEQNASNLFGANTFYSTEGSSLCIRAMLYLVLMHAKECGKKPIIAAGRNAHKAFMSGVALLDIDVKWLYGEDKESYLSCRIDAEYIEKLLTANTEKPVAVYLTSPDYLGNIIDVCEISKVCHKYGVLLLVDNAHGSYLKFLPESQHPIDLGAEICCDSAHKTLPVLTGGAYLHISKKAPCLFKNQAKNALALFGSTSPSYLILQSLDYANMYIKADYMILLSDFVSKVNKLKNKLRMLGYTLVGNEPLKITIATKNYGYTGEKFAELLEKYNLVCEFCDPDFVVLMLTPEIDDSSLVKIENILSMIRKKEPVTMPAPCFCKSEKVLSIREAMFSIKEELRVDECCGKVLAAASVGCPPAVPIVVCGERINRENIECFKYYNIDKCAVVK